MERQSTSKLFRALIAVVAFFVLCTSAILFASCGTDPLKCEHDLTDSKVVAITKETCGTTGTVTYECSNCGAEVTVTGTLATGEHTWVNGKCSVCGIAQEADDGLTLKDINDVLTNLLSKVDSHQQAILSALNDADKGIPSLDKKLAEILESVQGLDNIEIEGFDPSEFDFLADAVQGEKVTLTSVITALYKQVHQLYVDYASKVGDKAGEIYELLVGADAQGNKHVHNWVLELKEGETYSCTEPNTYVWGCAFCDEVKEGDVVVKATGHAVEFKTGLTDAAHHFDATCISGARVEGHCANCGEWTGEWNTVGQPTYQHHYVLEDGTDANGTVGTKGSCTSVHQYVYHCETCGGAYVEETKPTGHQYYYKLEDGVKVALTDEEKDKILKDYYGANQNLSQLTEEEKGLALQPYLNIVYSSDPTCVDPGLVVVECVECGVRYSYTTGEGPSGHSFVVKIGKDATCTMDGTAGYAYCEKCGYFFEYNGTAENDNAAAGQDGEVTKAVGAHSRNYIRNKDGRVIHYTQTTAGNVPEAVAGQGALGDLYEVITSAKPANGHHYVPVYTNTVKCVTSQTYILVCDKCFSGLSDLYKVNDNLYTLKDLTGNNIDDLKANGVVAKALAAVVKASAQDAATSDLAKDWAAVSGEGATVDGLAAFFTTHTGYLTRDAADDEKFESDSAKLLAQLKKLSVEQLKALYNDHNVVVKETKAAQGTTPAEYATVEFVNPVKGHSFNDKIVTIVGGCTMYERHVYICHVCGQETLTEGTGEGPATVVGDADTWVAGQKTATVPEGFKTDLQKEWDAVVAAEPEVEPESAWQHVMMGQFNDTITWLAQHGYLNDLSDDKTPTGATADEILNRKINRLMQLIYETCLDPETSEPVEGVDAVEFIHSFFTGKNVLNEFTVTTTHGVYTTGGLKGEPDDEPIELGHKFTAVAYIGNGETCDAPAYYVYVCSVCGKPASGTPGTFEFYNGPEKVTTTSQLFAAPQYKADAQVFEDSIPEARRTAATGKTAEFTKSDFELEWDALVVANDAAATAQNQLEWLIYHGYLNNVIDSLMLFGYGEGEDHVDGDLEKAIKENATKTGTDHKTLQALYDEVYANYYTIHKVGNVVSSVEFKVSKQGSVKEAAEAIALAKGYTTGTGDAVAADLTKFYTKSGDGVVATAGKAANKTSGEAATVIPESGHVWLKEDGTTFDPTADPLCLGFASEKLKAIYDAGKTAKWNETKKEWEADGNLPANLPTEFTQNVAKYGILAACKRGANCPLHGSSEKATARFAAGYYAATDHVTSYEKFTASSLGYPTGTVESEKVYYNYNTVDFYNNEEAAAGYLAEGKTWAVATATEKSAAAQKAMDADLLNLETLQKYWNRLFVDAAWLAADDVTGTTAAAKKAVSDARKAAYPTIELDASLLTDGDINYEALQTKFTEAGVPNLWKAGTVEGEVVSAWRPLSDVQTDGRWTPSCWVSLRCKWYHYEGNTCSKGYPDVNHTYPLEGAWFGQEAHLANCQHKDLCMTCGQEIGKVGGHNAQDVTTITDAHLREAWVKVLEEAKNTKETTGFLAKVKAAVWFVEDVDFTNFDWSKDWGVYDACYDSKNYEIVVCTGELEAIYNNLHSTKAEKPAWNAGINWVETTTTVTGNWKVTEKAVATNDHSWGDATPAYETRFYYLSNYYVAGELIGAKDAEIYVNANGTPVTADTEGAVKVTSATQIEFSQILCDAGYYTRQFCTHILGHDIVKDGVTQKAGTVCGAENTVARVEHQAIGHTFAPVQGYKNLGELYQKPTATQNAIVAQVCTNCGLHAQGEWGKNGVDGNDPMFNLATQTNVDSWNEHATAWNTAHPEETALWLAQMIETDDVLSNTAASGLLKDANGLYVYKTGETITLTATVSDNVISAGKDVTVVVGKSQTLTVKANAGENGKILVVNGTLAIVGEVGEDGKPLSTVKFDGLAAGGIQVNGGHLILKDIKVELGDNYCGINPGHDGKGSAIELSNVEITAKGPAFLMNATKSQGTNKIVIENSTLISTGATGNDIDVALSIWKSNVELTATNSIFAGAEGGALIRSGKATFTNCKFLTKSSVTNSNSSWGEGTYTPAHAALIVGNGLNVKDYGDATVTLTNCTFGTYSNSYSATATPGTCNSSDLAIAAYSTEKTETTLTVDAKSLLSAGTAVSLNPGTKTVSGKQVETLTYMIPAFTDDDLGKSGTADEKKAQAAAAGTLIKSVLTSGGTITLPKISNAIDFTTSGNVLTVAAGETASIDLGQNTVNVKTTTANSVNGNLTIKNGTISATTSTAVDFAVEAGASLTLDTVTAKFSQAGGILVKGEAENKGNLTIKNSTIIGVDRVVTTNNTSALGAVITIEGSEIQATGLAGCAVLINNEAVTLNAKTSTFYGKSTAVWVRAGVATFDGCTFVTGGWRVGPGQAWGTGANIATEAHAALVVGDNFTSPAYGDAEVTIKGNSSVVRGWVKDGSYTTDSTVTFNTNGTLNTKGEATATALAKRFVVASDSDSTTVTFETKALADAFTAETKVFEVTPVTFSGLVKDKNVFYTDTNNNTVRYISGGTTAKPQYTDVEVTFAVDGANLSTSANTALTDAAVNGGKVVLPKLETAGTVTLSADVNATEDVELVLGDNTLALGANKVVARDGADLTISGGKVTASGNMGIAKAGAGNVTLSNVTFTSTSVYGVSFVPKTNGTAEEDKTCVWTIENSVLVATAEGATALWVNGLVDKAALNITNSVLIGSETGLEVAGDATVTATNSTFFGKSAAVQLNSGNSTFTGCTFVGADQANGSAFNGGNGYPDEAKAIFVVAAKGDGYGATVTAKLTSCKFAVATNAIPDATSTNKTELVAGESVKSGYYYSEADQTTKGNAHNISLTTCGSTTINFTTDVASELLKIGTNVFAYNEARNAHASNMNATVKNQIKVTGATLTEESTEVDG